MERYSDFIELVSGYFSSESTDMVVRAMKLAASKLDGLERYDATPIMDHSIGVAKIVITEIGLGRNSTISTLLHDVVRLNMMSPQEVGALFGVECTSILKGLYNISEVDTKVSGEQASNFRDLIVSYSNDPRVILIKLADRLEVMRTLHIFPVDKQKKKSWESINLYAQIAHKLGLYSIKGDLEDLSLRYLEAEQYAQIVGKLKASDGERNKIIDSFIEPVEAKLREKGITYHLKRRTKSVYSIWSKMRRTGIAFEEIYDILALRIIIDTPAPIENSQCWEIYSILGSLYTPSPERMRNWIDHPKSNGYESLHGTFMTADGRWVEVQIRSERMDAVAERGIAAHWRYKGVNQGGMGSEQWLAKLRELMENNAPTSELIINHTPNEIFIFTPDGDLRKLPEGATVLDFAFDIHSNLGASCTGAIVNSRAVPIKETLHSGDVVKILTSKGQKPKLDWLSIVTTSKAKNRIRAYVRELRAKAANIGREELERKLKNWKLPMSMDDAVTVLCKHYKKRTGTEVYGLIADDTIDISEVKDILAKQIEAQVPLPPKSRAVGNRVEADKGGDALIIEDGLNNLDYKFAKCCNPISGDEIFAFVTVSAGITVHRSDCPNAQRLEERYPYRVMSARWRNLSVAGAFCATIRVVAEQTQGLQNAISDVVTGELKLKIRSTHLVSGKSGISGTIDVEVPNSTIVDLVVYSILKIRGVKKAHRIN